MRLRSPLALRIVTISFLALSTVWIGGQISALGAQGEAVGVTIEDLARTMPLPFAKDPAIASLERIAIAPNGMLDIHFPGPVLFYIEQGALNVDYERHRLVIVHTGDQEEKAGGDKGFRRGNIPTGYGVYSADGNPGPLRNISAQHVVLLAVLFSPETSGGESVTAAATAVAP